jgi:hypothetical protein
MSPGDNLHVLDDCALSGFPAGGNSGDELADGAGCDGRGHGGRADKHPTLIDR